jgi:hypothetical protein
MRLHTTREAWTLEMHVLRKSLGDALDTKLAYSADRRHWLISPSLTKYQARVLGNGLGFA